MNNEVISADKLSDLCPYLSTSIAALYATSLEQFRVSAGEITTTSRVAHFMAQVAAETWGFKHLVENLSYTADRLFAVFPSHFKGIDDAKLISSMGQQAIANRIYANRNGNGDEASGDGWKYRGRGFIQLTGRYNYHHIGEEIAMDLEENPDQLSLAGLAALAATRYWKWRGCNALADKGDIEAITKAINGGVNGLEDREAWLIKAKRIWA